jgi:catechol 2,3-dioxygenase-like lactoylglutathione lyase family enzyme
MVKFNGINHLAMVTADMDKTVRYWRDLLGLRLVVGIGGPGYRHYFFEISKTDLVAFFEWTGAESVPEKDHGAPVKGPIIFDHVSLGVETEDDLWELKDRLDAAGFWVSEVVDHGFIRSIYSFDPNGIPVEFSSSPGGETIRAHPVMGDRQPSEVTREGADPVKSAWPQVTEGVPRAERRVYPGAGSELFGVRFD